jgi:hypothetical protein
MTDEPDEGADDEVTDRDEHKRTNNAHPRLEHSINHGIAGEMSVLGNDRRPVLPNPLLEGIKAVMQSPGWAAVMAKEIEDRGIQAQFKNVADGLTNRIAVDPEVLRQLSGLSTNFLAGMALNYSRFDTGPAKGPAAYSDEMRSADDYFRPWERTINTFAEFQSATADIVQRNPESTFLWRGQQNAAWPLHSSLFRRLWKLKKVHDPDTRHRQDEPFPTEQEMVQAEIAILNYIRDRWPFEDSSALSTFARLQHFGAPTRLLDVSRNPLIAAWFATEAHSQPDVEESDARVFALAMTRVAPTSPEHEEDLAVSRVDLASATSLQPFWHTPWKEQEDSNSGISEGGEWGTGRIRRFWIPPHYESRIAAQSAAFVLDGVPVKSPQLDHFYIKGSGQDGVWSLADRLAASSISIRFSRTSHAPGPVVARNFPPSYTFRITAEAKHDIRRVLEQHYSYSASTIYPDIQGAAQALSGNLDQLLSGLAPA